MKPLALYDFLRVGHVKRWHNVNTVHQQTVAEHQYMVALIAMHLSFVMVGEVNHAREVMHEAMFHDTAEVAMGDVPSPAKALYRQLSGKGDLDIFEKAERLLMPALPYGDGKSREGAMRFVKLADKIADAHWIGENGVGAHAEIVKDVNWQALTSLVLQYETLEPTAGWHKAVNDVLMALGMKYVSLVTRTSPP